MLRHEEEYWQIYQVQVCQLVYRIKRYFGRRWRQGSWGRVAILLYSFLTKAATTENLSLSCFRQALTQFTRQLSHCWSRRLRRWTRSIDVLQLFSRRSQHWKLRSLSRSEHLNIPASVRLPRGPLPCNESLVWFMPVTM
uniref:Uncharacterized protein n=1 Tax=Toxoplasma gondii (strain ATCC 50861 / VEG) TaxID=432359 RepID=A0A0F7V671_TOXGV|nr:TPA: hypothetical protein BN1205_063340 [Toxoplasma gondii VEG]